MRFKQLIFNIAIPLLAFFGLVFVNQSHLREGYIQSVRQLPTVAYQKLDRGEEVETVTKWVVEKRNQLKVEAREKGGFIAKRWAEERNRKKYNNPIGPSYEFLFNAIQSKSGGTTKEVNLKIIDGSGRTSTTVDQESVIVGWVGRVMIVILLGIIIYRIYTSNVSPKRDIVIPELGRVVGGLLGGSLGVHLGVMLAESLANQEHLVTFGRLGGTLFSVIIASIVAFVLTKILSNALNKIQSAQPSPTATKKESVLAD